MDFHGTRHQVTLPTNRGASLAGASGSVEDGGVRVLLISRPSELYIYFYIFEYMLHIYIYTHVCVIKIYICVLVLHRYVNIHIYSKTIFGGYDKKWGFIRTMMFLLYKQIQFCKDPRCLKDSLSTNQMECRNFCHFRSLVN